MWPVDKMSNAMGPGYQLTYGQTGEDYLRWDKYNNRGFAHVALFVIVRTIISIFVYGWMFYEQCCNKRGKKCCGPKSYSQSETRDRDLPKD